MVCVLGGALPLLLYYSKDGLESIFGGDPACNHPCMLLLHRLSKVGLRDDKGGAVGPLVCPHLTWLLWPPPSHGRPLDGPGPSPGGFHTQIVWVSWAFFFIPLCSSAICFSELRLLAYFPPYLCISPAK
jgi:hypothetical protein